MMIHKIFLVFLALAMLNYVLPPSAWADGGEKATRSESQDYARREAASPGLEEFRGGDSGLGILITILVIAAIVVVVYYIVEHHHRHAFNPAKGAPPLAHGAPCGAGG